MKEHFTLFIYTPEKLYKKIEVEELNITTKGGQIGVLPHHLSLVASLEISIMTLDEYSHRRVFAIAGGTFSFNQKENCGYLFTDAIESQDEIDIDRATNAKERATIAIKEAESDRNQAIAEIKLKKAINRLAAKNFL